MLINVYHYVHPIRRPQSLSSHITYIIEIQGAKLLRVSQPHAGFQVAIVTLSKIPLQYYRQYSNTLNLSIFGGQSTVGDTYPFQHGWFAGQSPMQFNDFPIIFPMKDGAFHCHNMAMIPECIPPCSMFLSYRTIHGYSY